MTYIPLDKENRMIRVGFGKNCGKIFFRFDFWFFGIRI
jgi:hypothetical protein